MKDMLVLWLASFGVDQETTDKILADKVIAMGIAGNDWSGMVTDLPYVLSRFGATEAFNALSDTKEQLFLMMALRGKL